MVTLTLKKKPGAGADSSPRHKPLRSSGLRQRPTLAEAQEQRARQAQELAPPPRAARPDARRERDEGRPGERDRHAARRGDDPRQDRRPGRPQDRQDERQQARWPDRPQQAHPQRRDARRDDPPMRGRPGERRDPAAPREGQPLRSVNNPHVARQIAERTGRPDRADRNDRREGERAPRPADRHDAAPARPLRSVANAQLARRMSETAAAAPGSPQRPTPVTPAATADGERLSKRMTALGLASRREADEWIDAGWVRVNGTPAVLGQRVQPGDRIEVDERAHQEQARRVTILLNKPVGYVSGQAEDGYEPAALLIRPENQWQEDRSGIRWHPGHLRNLAPAGRLDIDSVGLLVLTQDGRVARQLIGDESDVEKEYLVRVEYTRGERLPDGDLALLNHGLSLDGHALRPCKVSWQNEDQLRFVLREGRKRQIRRMCEAVGLKVVGLKRVRIGSVPLGHLPPGQWRYLRRDEYFA